jgi:hypothetical protein
MRDDLSWQAVGHIGSRARSSDVRIRGLERRQDCFVCSSMRFPVSAGVKFTPPHRLKIDPPDPARTLVRDVEQGASGGNGGPTSAGKGHQGDRPYYDGKEVMSISELRQRLNSNGWVLRSVALLAFLSLIGIIAWRNVQPNAATRAHRLVYEIHNDLRIGTPRSIAYRRIRSLGLVAKNPYYGCVRPIGPGGWEGLGEESGPTRIKARPAGSGAPFP